jgi:hypothetical protein
MAGLGTWAWYLGRENDGPERRELPRRQAALQRWYDFLDREKERAKVALAKGRIKADAYGLRLDELGELEAALSTLAMPVVVQAQAKGNG